MTLDTHLGRSATGKKNAAYQTPDKADSSLLVAVPRSENRVQHGLRGKMPFVGFDVWHSYEFSMLNEWGCPRNFILKIVYPSNSKYIVESKSLKLYLNSYNMEPREKFVSLQIQKDLSDLLKTDVIVNFFSTDEVGQWKDKFREFKSIDDVSHYINSPIEFYNENPLLLSNNVIETGYASKNYILIDRNFQGSSAVLRSNCKVTNQPDWADVFIYWSGDYTVEEKDLYKYLLSFRNENHFHEEICEAIYKRLWDILKPDELFVACLYTRRGGIDINPIRASNVTLLNNLAPLIIDSRKLTAKTGRQ
jgi:7-cyano-7-deazaguanine reductase